MGRNSFGHFSSPGQLRHCHCSRRQDFRGRWKVRAQEFSFGGNGALRFRFRFESNPARFFRNQIRKSIGPFDDGNTVAKKIVVESESFGRWSIFNPKKIEVIDRQTSSGIFVNERESRTGRGRSRAQTGGEAFDQLRLAAAESAAKRNHIASFDVVGEPPAERARFVRTIGNERSHRTDVEKLSRRDVERDDRCERSEERRVGKECRYRWSPYH